MVSQQTCTCDHKMDQRMWQTSSTFDLLHAFHEWIQTVLSCGKYCTTIQISTVSRPWLCRRSWRFEIDFSWNVVYFRKPHICACKLYVQETDISFTHFNGIWDYFSGCRCLRMDGISALDLWDLIIDVLQKRLNSQNKTPVSKENLELSTVDFVSSNANSCHKEVRWKSLKTTKQWSRWSSKAEVQQWDVFPEPKELRLIGCSTESTWTQDPNQMCWHQNPTRRHPKQRKLYSWWMEPPFYSTSAFSALQAALKRCRKGRRRNGEERIAAKSKPVINHCLQQCQFRRHLRAREVSDLNSRVWSDI